jgi:hypothetical protein
MATDVIIDPSTGQIYWNDSASSGAESISIKGDAVNTISFTGYSASFSPGSTPAGAQTLVTIKDSGGTDALIPGTTGYNLGSSTLRWNTFATNANLSGTLVVSDTTISSSTTTGAATVSGGVGIGGTLNVGGTISVASPISIPNGGTNASSFGQSAGFVYYDGTSVRLLAASGATINYTNGYYQFDNRVYATSFFANNAQMPNGSGTAGRVTIWSGNNTIGSDAGFAYDATNDILTVPIVYSGTALSSPTYTSSASLAFKPGANATSAIALQKADGTNILVVDTVNNLVGINKTPSTYALDVNGNSNLTTTNAYYIAGVSVLSASTLGGNVLSSSLTSVGVISSGTWSGSTITAFYGGTGLQGPTAIGDLIVANTATTWSRYATSATSGQVLTSNGTGSAPSWQNVPPSSASSVAVAPTTVGASFFVTAVNTSSSSGVGLSTITSFVVNPNSGIVSLSGLAVTNSTVSINTTSGALIVTGGVGIGGSLYTSTGSSSSVSGVILANGNVSATTYNKLTLTAPASSATLTLANNSSLITSGANSLTLTTTAASSVTLPTAGTLTTTGNKLSVFASTLATEFINVISGTTGTGNLVFASSPSLTTPTLGVASATTINKVTITAPTTSATLTLVDGSSLTTAGAFGLTLTTTAASNVTFPTAGTLLTSGATSPNFLTSVTTGSGTFALFNTTATTINAFGQATAMSIGAATGKATFNSTDNSTSTITGGLVVSGGAGVAKSVSIGGRLQMFNSSLYTAFSSAQSGVNTTYTLPTTSPATGSSVLQSTAAGIMSWVPMSSTSGVVNIAVGSYGYVQYAGIDNALAANANFQYDDAGGELVLKNYALNTAGNQSAGLKLLGFSAGWDASDGGTFLAINAGTGFTGDLIHAQFNGVSRLQLSNAGYLRLGVAGTGFTLPITNGTSGQVLTANTNGIASWTTVSGGGTPGGSNKQIQFNNSSAFGGASGFEYTTGGIANTVSHFAASGTGYTSGMWIHSINGSTTRVGIGLSNPQFELEILGEISATNKSFVINHPTKSGMKLRYGSLEGPENGVYVRGELNNSNIIEVPDHWVGLVHEDSYTVHLTPIGSYAQLYVEKIENYNVFVADNMMCPIHCYYSVWAERKDIPKLVTEY